MTPTRRGHILLLLMVVLSATLVAGSMFMSRVSSNIEGREADQVRLQALWLARTAADAGATGVEQVQTPVGVALVRIERGAASTLVEVDLAGAQAVVSSPPHTERFSPAPVDQHP